MPDVRDRFLRLQDQLAPRFIWIVLGLAGAVVPLTVLAVLAHDGWMFMAWPRLAFGTALGLVGVAHASLALFTLWRDERWARIAQAAMNPLLGLMVALAATSVFLLSMIS